MDRSRETTIRRDASGQWYADGEPVTHPGVAEAFARWVDRAPDGRWCLKNDIHWVYVEIEGAPVFVEAVRVRNGRVELALSDQRAEVLDPTTLRQGSDGALYCDVRDGLLPAQFRRGAALQLEDVLGEDEEGVFVEVGGRRFHPPVVSAVLERPAARRTPGVEPAERR